MPKSRQRWVTSLSISSKVPGIEQQIDALARGQLAGVVLLLQPLLAAAQFRAPLEVGEMLDWIHRLMLIGIGVTKVGASRFGYDAIRRCAFSQSSRNFFRPMSVSG